MMKLLMLLTGGRSGVASLVLARLGTAVDPCADAVGADAVAVLTAAGAASESKVAGSDCDRGRGRSSSAADDAAAALAEVGANGA